MTYMALLIAWTLLLSIVSIGWVLLHLQMKRWGSKWVFEPQEAHAFDLGELCIVIPARNESRVIESCLQSLVECHGASKVEIVVVDDNSSDGTGGIARGFKAKLPGLRVISGAPRPPDLL